MSAAYTTEKHGYINKYYLQRSLGYSASLNTIKGQNSQDSDWLTAEKSLKLKQKMPYPNKI